MTVMSFNRTHHPKVPKQYRKGDKNVLRIILTFSLHSRRVIIFPPQNCQYTHYVLWLSVQLAAQKNWVATIMEARKMLISHGEKANFQAVLKCVLVPMSAHLNTQFAFAI